MSKEIELKAGDRILISRTDRLGDLVLALPFVETLKSRYPECKIDVLASLYASPILENNDLIDGIMRVQNDQLFKDPLYKRDLFQKIKAGEYKIVVALYPERQVSQLFYKAAIPYRLGTARRFHSVFFNQHLFHTRKVNKKHEFEYNQDFLQFFKEGKTISRPTVYPTDKEFRNARRILGEKGVGEHFVILHPGSGGSAERWPLDKFIHLYKLLADSEIDVLFSGSEQERDMIQGMSDKLGIKARLIAGETDLRTLAAALSLADVVVANSTGPLHLAVAVGTNVVGLYPGRVVMSPVRWGPLGDGHRVIQPSIGECLCPQGECRCMETIEEQAVADNVISLYRQGITVG